MSLIVEVTKPSEENLKNLSDAEQNGDHSEGVHGTEEDGLFKVFGYHALSDIKSLFQSAGIARVQRVNLRERQKHE